MENYNFSKKDHSKLHEFKKKVHESVYCVMFDTIKVFIGRLTMQTELIILILNFHFAHHL